MAYDKNLLCSDSQSIAAVASTLLSDTSVDTWKGRTSAVNTAPIGGPLLNDVGRNGLPVLCEIVETVTSGGAATVDFHLVQADDAALSTNLATVASTGALALATMVAGYQVGLPPAVPPGRVTQRFIGFKYIIAVATTTAGKVFAGFNINRNTNLGGI